MKLTTEAKNMQEIVSSVMDVDQEAQATVTDSGIQIIAIDKASVLRLQMNVDKDMFDTYEVDEVEGDRLLEMDVATLNDAIRKFDKDDDLTIEDIDGGSKLKLSTDNSEFKLKLVENLDLTEVDLDSISENLTVKGNVNISDLKRSVNAAAMFGGTVKLTADDGLLTVECDGNMGSTKQSMAFSGGSGEASSMFAEDYLKKLVSSGRNISDDMTIQMGDDFPMRVDFEGENVSGTYLVAPRIEE